VELFEQIRLEYEFGVGTIQGVARKLRVHRRVVREAIQSALPARRKKTERPHIKMAPAAEFVDAILEEDRKVHRKQRHTATRIWHRIREEVPGCTAAERTVRLYVEQRKEALGFGRHEIFVPQSCDWGIEAQVDELGYVPLAEVAAELLFQVIAERAEKAAIIVTTNLPFSEWPQVFTNARLCKAVLDRLTDQAHIIETGSESYRFRRTLRKKRKE